MELTRREMLKLGLLGSAALFLPLERAAKTSLNVQNRLTTSQLPKPFTTPFTIPPVLQPKRKDATTDYYEIRMNEAAAQILPKDRFRPTKIWGYNGITPGPTIKVRQGRKTVVRQINELPRTHPVLGYESWTSVHLHGSASLPQYDGYANDITYPGQYKDYRYPNFQPARTLWYHDHGVHHTAENVYMGLAAQYHLIDASEQSLPIPRGRYEVPLIIQDKIFATDGSFIFDDGGHSGLFGDVILVNGKPWPRMRVERRKYRFRILNASVSRSYNLALDSGEPLTVIGHDGGLAPAPQQVGNMRIGMAERYEVVIDFAKYPVGSKVILKNLGLPNNVDHPSTRQIMRFDVVSEATDTTNNEVPAELVPAGNNPYDPMQLQESQSTHTKRFVFERKDGEWMINGRTWHDVEDSDHAYVEEKCAPDQIEIWELENKSGGWFHPIHVHLVDFKILDRNGKPPFPWERGPKDVAYVGENELVRVIAKFGPQKGKYMMHCHNLVHEDHDMMTQFQVGGEDGPAWDSDPARPLSEAPPL